MCSWASRAAVNIGSGPAPTCPHSHTCLPPCLPAPAPCLPRRPARRAPSTAPWVPAALPWSTSPTCPSALAAGWWATTQPTGRWRWLAGWLNGQSCLQSSTACSQPHEQGPCVWLTAPPSCPRPAPLSQFAAPCLPAAPPRAAVAWFPTASSPRRPSSTTCSATTPGKP